MAERLVRVLIALPVPPTLAVLAFVLANADQYLTSPTRALLFLGAPAGLIVGLAVIARLGREARAVAVLSLYCVALGAYGAEAWLTWATHPRETKDPVFEAAARAGQPVDRRTRRQVVDDLRQEGRDAWPAVFPEYLLVREPDGSLRSPVRLDGREVLPLGGIAGARTVLCNESGQFAVYDADRYGFNNPDMVWDDRPADVLLLGDSFVQGYCVPSGSGFADLIRAARPATVNLGMSGSGPLVELAALLEYGPALRPRHVVWFFFEGNDIPGNLSVEKRSPLLRAYLDNAARQDLARRARSVDAALRDYVAGFYAAHGEAETTHAGSFQGMLAFVGLSALRSRLAVGASAWDEDRELYRSIVAGAATAIAEWGGRLTLVYLPEYGRAVGRANPVGDELRRFVLATARDNGARIVDLAEAVARDPDPRRFYPYGLPAHFAPAGHQFVAQRTLEALR